jgi:hypothetical protein
MCLVFASAFVTTMCVEGRHKYKPDFRDFDRKNDRVRDVINATGPEPTISFANQACAQVFYGVD